MNITNIDYKFNENLCEFKIPITKKAQNVTNCDIFVKESSFILVSDVDIRRLVVDSLFCKYFIKFRRIHLFI